MGDILSIIVVVVLFALIVVSVQRQRAMTAGEDEDLKLRVGADGAPARALDGGARKGASRAAGLSTGRLGLDGACRARTGDLRVANAALSQLS